MTRPSPVAFTLTRQRVYQFSIARDEFTDNEVLLSIRDKAGDDDPGWRVIDVDRLHYWPDPDHPDMDVAVARVTETQKRLVTAPQSARVG